MSDDSKKNNNNSNNIVKVNFWLGEREENDRIADSESKLSHVF